MNRLGGVPALLVVLVLSALAAGCGVPSDGSPRAIGEGRVPPDLLEPDPANPAPEAVPGDRAVRVYFLDGELLRSVVREVSVRTPEAILGALLAGVVPEDPPGMSTALPGGLRVAQIQRVESADTVTVVVELSAEILDIGAQLQKAAFAQLVYTVTEVGGIDGVRFRVGDRDLPVITDAGGKTEPVTRADFRSLRPND